MLRARAIVPLVAAAAVVSAYTATAASATGTTSAATNKVLVKFSPTATASDRAAAESAVGATEVGTVRDLDVHVLSVPANAVDAVVAALSNRAGVVYAEPDAATQAAQAPNDPKWGIEWGPIKINAASAWDKTTGSASVVVAVLDTGVDYTHPDLQGTHFVAGYDFVNNDTDPSDDNGHGTNAVGVLAASTNNGTGMAGMCWSCSIMPVKVLDSSGSGSDSALASGITWATDHGAQVISMSLASTSDSTTMHSAVQYAHNHGVVLVAAAGNASSSTPTYPAAYAEVLGVAGTQSDDTLYSWSDYGSWVKVAAPGCNIATMLGGGYGTFCGTSAATPVVAGLAALARSYQPSATNLQVEAAIESSAVSIGTAASCGRVDAAAALTALGNGATSAACATASSTGGTTGGSTRGGGKKH